MENKEDLVIERIFDAPREKVWRAWTDPEMVKKWWGPAGFTAPYVEMDFKVGGKYLNCMHGQGMPVQDYWSTGTYEDIVPMEKIVATDSFADEKGNVVPASHYGMDENFPLEMKITVIFEDAGVEKTKLTLRHKGFPTKKDLEGARMGWGSSLDKFAKALE